MHRNTDVMPWWTTCSVCRHMAAAAVLKADARGARCCQNKAAGTAGHMSTWLPPPAWQLTHLSTSPNSCVYVICCLSSIRLVHSSTQDCRGRRLGHTAGQSSTCSADRHPGGSFTSACSRTTLRALLLALCCRSKRTDGSCPLIHTECSAHCGTVNIMARSQVHGSMLHGAAASQLR